jgi:hypothetical protein
MDTFRVDTEYISATDTGEKRNKRYKLNYVKHRFASINCSKGVVYPTTLTKIAVRSGCKKKKKTPLRGYYRLQTAVQLGRQVMA